MFETGASAPTSCGNVAGNVAEMRRRGWALSTEITALAERGRRALREAERGGRREGGRTAQDRMREEEEEAICRSGERHKRARHRRAGRRGSRVRIRDLARDGRR